MHTQPYEYALPDIQQDIVYILKTPDRAFLARGVENRLPPGVLDTLDARVRAFFSGQDGRKGLLVGAFPFERTEQDCFFQPEDIREGFAFQSTESLPVGTPLALTLQPSRAEYADWVRRALSLIGEDADADPLRKVVLSRALTLTAARPIAPLALGARLAAADPSVATFVVPLPADHPGETRVMVGATPELLLSKRGRNIASHPLAGSARREKDPEADGKAADTLLHSGKDQREHALVVESILDTLAPFCDVLSAPQQPSLRSTAAMWHLGTRITGRLKDPDVGSAGLAAALHPTPAIAGYPAAKACRAIREIETHRRDFYAGALGWIDSAGNGDWYVTLRCAEIAGARISLFAGAGIVAGSDPEAEAAETSAKLETMLRALGLDEQGKTLAESPQ